MHDQSPILQLSAVLVLAVGLLAPAAARGDLDPECVLRLAETAAADMTLAELRAQCEAAPVKDVAAADAQNAASTALAAEPPLPVKERLAAERESVQRPFTIMAHEPNYLLVGAYNAQGWDSELFKEAWGDPDYSNRDVEAQFQISLKVPLAIGLFDQRMDLYGAYTNRSFWQVYNDDYSKPFRETNHEPEIWAQFGNDWTLFGFANTLNAVGLVHQSNGQGGVLSRSWNRLYANFIFEKGRWAISVKPWLRLDRHRSKDDNPDITDYLGHGELRLAYERHGHVYSLMTRNQIESGFDHGALEFSWSFPVFDYPYLKGYIQYFNGYGESLIDYDHRTNRIGIGIALTDWLD
jgi:phospholipase A1/A2